MNKTKTKHIQSALCIFLGIFSLGVGSVQGWEDDEDEQHLELLKTVERSITNDSSCSYAREMIEEGSISPDTIILWGEDLFLGGGKKYTPLLSNAVGYNQTECALALLEAGTSSHLGSRFAENKYCPLSLALERNNLVIAEALYQSGADLNALIEVYAPKIGVPQATPFLTLFHNRIISEETTLWALSKDFTLDYDAPYAHLLENIIATSVIRRNNPQITLLLLEKGAKIQSNDDYLQSLTLCAATGSDPSAFIPYWEDYKQSLDEGDEIAIIWESIAISSYHNDVPLTQYFLKQIPSEPKEHDIFSERFIAERTENLNKYYSQAIRAGNLDVAKLLAEYGAQESYIDSAYRIAYEYIDHVKNHPVETGLAYTCALGGFAGAHYLGGQYLPEWAEGQITAGVAEVVLAGASQRLLGAQAATQELQATLKGLKTDEAAARAAVKAAQRALTDVGGSSASLQELTGKNAAEWTQTIIQHMKNLVNEHEDTIRSLSAYEIPNKPQAYYAWFKANFQQQVEGICESQLPHLGEKFKNTIQKIANYQFFLALQEKAGWAKVLKLPRPTQLWDAVTNPAWIEANEAVKTAQANLEGAKQAIQQTQSQLTTQNKIIGKEQAKQLQQNERAQAARDAEIARLRAEAGDSFSRKMARIGLGLGGAYAGYELCGSAGAYIDDWMFGDSSDN